MEIVIEECATATRTGQAWIAVSRHAVMTAIAVAHALGVFVDACLAGAGTSVLTQMTRASTTAQDMAIAILVVVFAMMSGQARPVMSPSAVPTAAPDTDNAMVKHVFVRLDGRAEIVATALAQTDAPAKAHVFMDNAIATHLGLEMIVQLAPVTSTALTMAAA